MRAPLNCNPNPYDLKTPHLMSNEQLIIKMKNQKKIKRIIDSSLNKLSEHVHTIPTIKLPCIMSKKVKELDQKQKTNALDQFDSSEIADSRKHAKTHQSRSYTPSRIMVDETYFID